MSGTNSISRVQDIFFAALKAVDPMQCILQYTDTVRLLYEKEDHRKLIVTAFGKAAYPMAQAVCQGLNDIMTNCMIITKYGHAFDTKTCNCLKSSRKTRIYEAGHPVPDINGVMATQEMISLIKGADQKTLVVCLISGGGSSLLVCPFSGITLYDKQKTTEMLLKTGADIHEVNTVRKHISRVKGGKLAELAYPATVVTLIMSDVIGDNPDIIASGPAVPDSTTFSDAYKVIQKYDLLHTLPPSVITHIAQGVKGEVTDTPPSDSRIFKKVRNYLIATNRQALEAAQKEAEKQGLLTLLVSSELTGEAQKVGRDLAHRALEEKASHHCLISGGETTVTVKGTGKGGRNMELALAFGLEIEGTNGITFLSAGTDGTDGPTDAAGALVNGETMIRARQMGLKPEAYLDNNDSYTFFKKVGGLFVTGPTQTNVMDISITLTS
jgi:glycerate 2-kinase